MEAHEAILKSSAQRVRETDIRILASAKEIPIYRDQLRAAEDHIRDSRAILDSALRSDPAPFSWFKL
jgi:hypothetical protein